MLGFLTNLKLSTPASIVLIIVAIFFVFFVFRLFSGFLRILISLFLFAVIAGIIYLIVTKHSLTGRAIKDVLPGLLFLRCKDGFWFWKKKEKS